MQHNNTLQTCTLQINKCVCITYTTYSIVFNQIYQNAQQHDTKTVLNYTNYTMNIIHFSMNIHSFFAYANIQK